MTKQFEEVLTEANVDENLRVVIQEAWNAKLLEARDVISTELREEFSQKFEHDKNNLIETVDRFVSEHLTAEITELAKDKANLVAERKLSDKQVREHIEQLDRFVVKTLLNEINELRDESKKRNAHFNEFEKFVTESLAEEIKNIRASETALVEQKVKIISEGKKTLSEAKSKFVARAAKLFNEHINGVLTREITQYKEDIEAARKNDFGRRIFESFASEYMTSFINTNSEVNNLSKKLDEQTKLVESLQAKIVEKDKLVENTQRQLKLSANVNKRKEVIAQLIAPLPKDKKLVMQHLLESAKFEDLQKQYQKYLPHVLKEGSLPQPAKTVITESTREVTGNRGPSVQLDDELTSLLALAKNRK